MQIEESFRDCKSPRFAFSLQYARFLTENPDTRHNRVRTLLLIAAMAQLMVHLIGTAAEKAGLQRRFQANTVKHRVLSLRTLAVELIRAGGLGRFRLSDLWRHLRHLQGQLEADVAVIRGVN